MALSDYALTPVTANTLADAATFNATIQDLEDTLLATAVGIVSGGAVTDGGGLTVDINGSVFLLGILLEAAATSVLLQASSTNRLWAVVDPDAAERVVYEVRTDATVPARAALLATIVTGVGTITSIDTAPAGRNDVVALGVLSELAAGWLTKSVAGGVAVTLTADEANHGVIELTGLLTASFNVIFPATAGRRWLVQNKTTGGFNLTYKTAAGTGVTVPTGLACWVRADGTDLVLAAPPVTPAGQVYALGGISLPDAQNVALGTTTGSQLGTSAAQKLGLWGKTPIIQPAGAAQAALTNSTGGTADGTLAAVSGSGADAVINDNLTELHTLLNALRSALVDAGMIKGSA